jgi:hypothetical protein
MTEAINYNVEAEELPLPNEESAENAEPVVPEEKGEQCEQPSELDVLRAELEELKLELARRDERDKSNSRMLKECGEFKNYFPDTELSSIDDEVWESVKNGVPLSAAYALYLRKTEQLKDRIEQLNRRNKEMSAGSVGKGGEESFYSPSEVKAMTREQVRENYKHVLESMRHWH